MTTPSAAAAAIAASRASLPEIPDRAIRLIHAARLLLQHLEQGRSIDAGLLRSAMEQALGGTDADGAWDWKSAYDACEAAVVLFLRRFGGAMASRAGSPAALMPMLAKVAGLLPTHTRRSEESETFQQFSTPLPVGLAVATAAAVAPADRVLEPSAGTGLLAVFAALAGASLVLNELADTRAGLLRHLFADAAVTSLDAAHIDDHLDPGVSPTVVLMNPPFSALANVDRRRTDAAMRHVSSALARLAEGGRLVAVTQASLAPHNPTWRDTFVNLQERGTVVFSAAIDGAVYARHGTTVETRLTVIDKRVAESPTVFPAPPGTAQDPAALLRWVTEHVPPRLPIAHSVPTAAIALPLRARNGRKQPPFAWASPKPRAAPPSLDGKVVELAYDTVDWKPAEGGRLSEVLYEDYALQSIRIPGAHGHPTRLVQSAAMASVAPPRPAYRPHLPARVLSEGLLSDAQLESVIYAGDAHASHLAGSWTVDATFDAVTAAPDNATIAVHFRRGWFLGDGTGCGKGRQVAGIILDNWLKGQLALLLGLPVSCHLLFAIIAAAGAATVLGFAVLAQYFPKEVSGRANAALGVLNMGTAFGLQCLSGFIVALWPADGGRYPAEAHQAAMASGLGLQLIALGVFFTPRRRLKPAPMAHAVARALRFGQAPLPIARPVYTSWTYQAELARRQRAAWAFAAAASAALCLGLAATLLITVSRPAVAFHVIQVAEPGAPSSRSRP